MFQLLSYVAYDGKGTILHRGDTVLLSLDEEFTDVPVEVFQVLDNRVAVIMPDQTLQVFDSGKTQLRPKPTPEAPHYDTPSTESHNEPKSMGQQRLLAPIGEPINQAADVLLALMKSVKTIVTPLQFNIKRVETASLGKQGEWQKGIIEAEIHVSDLMLKHKAMVAVSVPIVDGKAGMPFGFKTSIGKVYPFTVEGFRRALNIPLTPYIGKRSPKAEMSHKNDY